MLTSRFSANLFAWVGAVACTTLLSVPSAPVARAAVGYDPALEWHTLHTPHFRLHYHDGETLLAKQAATVAEQVHERLSQRLLWLPAGPTDVVLTDRVDISNGSASPFPSNQMILYVTAPDRINGLEDHGGWLETLITHEYTHILHLDKAQGTPRHFRDLFGRNPLLFPAMMQPKWFLEGLATYVETDPARGIGRGQSSYYNMLMRMEVAGGVKPLRQVNQPVRSWPSGDIPYLYGVNFFNFVEQRWGAPRINTLVDGYSDNILPYFINYNSRQALGEKLPAVWREFEGYLHQRYGAQLERVSAAGVNEGRRITGDGFRLQMTRASDDGTLYYIRDNGKSRSMLMRKRPGGPAQTLAELNPLATFDVHPQSGIVVSQLELERNTNLFYDLYRIDGNGNTTRLSRGGRYRLAVWHPDGRRIVAVHNALGRHSLHLLDAQGRRLENWWEASDGELISGLDVAPDGRSLVATVWRRSGGWNLERFDIAQRRWQALTADSAIQAHPQFSGDGKAVYFSADYDGIYNIYRMDLETRELAALTNVRGGGFFPTQNGDGSLYYIGYTPQGFDVFNIDAPMPRLLDNVYAGPSAAVASPPETADDGVITPYQPLKYLRPRWWSPQFFFDDSRSEYGITTSASDPLSRHNYVVDALYDTKNDLVAGAFSYVYDRWNPSLIILASRFNSFQRGIFDDGQRQTTFVARIRENDALSAQWLWPFYHLHQRWAARTAVVHQATSNAFTAVGVSPLPKENDNLLGVNVSYISARRYPLSISRSDGRDVLLTAEDSELLGGDFSGQVYTLDWREFIGLGGEHVLALRGVGAWGTQSPRPFQLGGFINPSPSAADVGVPGGASPFNRRDYPLRGYPEGLPALSGRHMALASLEWRLPLVRIERGIMAPPLAIDQFSATFFADAGSAWDDGATPQRLHKSAGMEFNADIIAFYSFAFRLRLGIAKGFDDAGVKQTYIGLGSLF